MEIMNCHHLLDQVSERQDKFKKLEEITGESFNVFRILKLDSAEVGVHSAFIAELLNPKGTHGQNDLFLKLFTNRFKFKQTDFITERARVEIEKYIGAISPDLTRGGRIDIVITDIRCNQILIENKIYARDKENQLLRYYNYNKTANLFYLCLFGGDVSEFSCGNLSKEHFRVISYEQDIVIWLTDCKKEVVDLPLLREGITQYINLIKYLTGHSSNQHMDKELAKLMASTADRFEAAYNITTTFGKVRKELIPQLKAIVEQIANELDLQLTFNFTFDSKQGGFYFRKPDWKVFYMAFEFDGSDRDLNYGLLRDEKCNNVKYELTAEISCAFEALKGKSNDLWPFYRLMDSPFHNWSVQAKESWLAIIDGSIKDVIKTKVEDMIKASNEIQGL